MKARVSADPKVDKDHDDPNKDSQGQDENQVEEEDLATVATLQEDQEEEVHDSQSEMRASFRSEGVEQPPCNPNQPTDIRPVRGQMPEDDPEDPVGEALIKRKSDIWKMIGEVCDEGLKLTDDTEKEEQEATMHALVGVTKTLEVQIKSHLKKIKLETKTLKRLLKKKKLGKKKKEKKDKRKRLEAEEENEEVPAQEPGVTGNATDVQERAMQRRSHKLQEERTKKQSADEAEELKRLVEVEESEEGKDAAAAKYLIKATGYSEEDCAELIRMEKVPGVSTIQAYHRAVNELNQAQQEYYRTLEPGAAAGTATYSGSGTGTGSGSGKPVYSAEFAAEMEAGPERPEDERETRRNKREAQRAQALKADERKKAKKTKEDENKAGPSGNNRNDQIKKQEEDRIKKQEEALIQMRNLTGCSEEECAQALINQTEPGKEFIKIYYGALCMLMGDDDPNKEGWANLAKGSQD